MPGNSAKATVTIDAEHETRTVIIDALKHVVSPAMMFVSILSLIGLVGVFRPVLQRHHRERYFNTRANHSRD